MESRGMWVARRRQREEKKKEKTRRSGWWGRVGLCQTGFILTGFARLEYSFCCPIGGTSGMEWLSNVVL